MSDFTNMSARLDTLIGQEQRVDIRIPISNKHHIFASITRVGLFKTGGISVELVSINKSGALLCTSHHALRKSLGKTMTIELSLGGKYFEHEAHIVRLDSINNLYGIKFHQSIIEAIENYLVEFNICPHYGVNTPKACSVWLNLP